jgi:hypothetical protein
MALFPVYEFRPLPDYFGGNFYRYAGGRWISDDGEYDLAFASNGYGPPICLYVELPYHTDLLWRWRTAVHVSDHPRGNPWHYMLRAGKHQWGRCWARDKHQNVIAADSGMSWLCGRHVCANGRSVQFDLNDKHIAAGLVREAESKRVVTVPDKPICMYCGEAWRQEAA